MRTMGAEDTGSADVGKLYAMRQDWILELGAIVPGPLQMIRIEYCRLEAQL